MTRIRSKGFTLIEVLIAFAILALVLGTVFRTLSSGLSHERTASIATARLLEGRSILDRLGVDLPLEAGSIDGELTTGEEWTITVRLVEPSEGMDADNIKLNAYLVELQVAGSDDRVLRLQALQLGP